MKSIKGEFSFKEFNFIYEKKAVKYLRLKLTRTGALKLSIPHFTSFEAVLDFVSKNETWIRQKQLDLSKMKAQNEGFYFLGKAYELCLNSQFTKTKLLEKQIQSPNEEALNAFLKANAKKIFLGFIKKWQKSVQKPIKRVSIKNMQTRWGSCNHNKAYINLNLKLIHEPLRAIEYVILHELAHLIYPHHQKEFYDFLASCMSDFRQREGLLKHKILA